MGKGTAGVARRFLAGALLLSQISLYQSGTAGIPWDSRYSLGQQTLNSTADYSQLASRVTDVKNVCVAVAVP